MLNQIRIQRYKSLYDVTVKLEPLTVFIGPNGSGKSSICEAIYFLSKTIEWIEQQPRRSSVNFPLGSLNSLVNSVFNVPNAKNKFWRGNEDQGIQFNVNIYEQNQANISQEIKIPAELIVLPLERSLIDHLGQTRIYDFAPTSLAQSTPSTLFMSRAGLGITYALADILLNDRERFDELEQRFIQFVPNIARIVLERNHTNNQLSLRLKDKSSNYLIPSEEISDGTLRLLAFLTALYEIRSPSIICFEEPENGVHPWLLHKLIELLTLVSTQGIRGQPIQILITTHSPAMLDLVKPEQVRAVELDKEGKTQVYSLPVEQVRFQKAMEAFDGDLGEMWFTNMFGGNPT